MNSSNKKGIIAGGIILGLLILAVAVLILSNGNMSGKKQAPQAMPQVQQGQPQPLTNPLINSEDAQRVNKDYQQKVKESGQNPGIKKQYHFKYELSPDIQGKRSIFSPKTVEAASFCNIVGAPDQLPVYSLKTHWGAGDAKDLASNEFNITSEPFSQPAEGGTFYYSFINPVDKNIFKVLESSGVYDLHIPITTPFTHSIDVLDAQKTALNELQKHNLADQRVAEPVVSADPNYVFRYRKKLGDGSLKLIDQLAVKTIGAGDSLCSVPDSNAMNIVEVYVRKDGVFNKLLNNSRKIITTQTLPKASIATSIKDFADKPITAPIVIPETASTPQAGTVVIDEVLLAYWDLGQLYAQSTYVPVYITSGTVKNDTSHTRVFTVFSAISEDKLKQAGILKDSSTQTSAQPGKYRNDTPQQASYDVTPAPTVPITPPPVAPAGENQCYGGEVDYQVNCNINGQVVCTYVYSAPSNNDPLGACGGCKSREKVVDASTGEDPCRKYLDSESLPPPPSYYDVVPFRKIQNPGSASCVVRGCPC